MNDLIVSVGNKKRTIGILPDDKIILDGKEFNVNLSKVSDYLYLIKINECVYEVTTVKKSSNEFFFTIDGRNYEVTARTALQERANEVLKQKELHAKIDSIKAPMPGLILKISKNIGEHINIGEPLIVLEAMKMENEIRSPSSGTITEIHYKQGDSVEKDAVILKIE